MFIFLFSLFILNRVQAAPFYADIKFFYYLENHWNYQGGIEEKNITTGAGFLEVDMSEQKFFPSMGYTQVYFSLMSYHGGSAAMQVGDTQWTSNIDSGGPEFIKIYDAYINQELFSDKFRFRVGLLDLCIDYNVNEVGLLFIHSAPGTSVDLSFSGANGAPIYPFPSFGFDLQYEHESGFYAMAAITSEFAGNSKNIDRTQTNPRISGDSNFHILEVGLEKDDSKMGIGYWGYASPFEHLTKAGQTNYQQGVYAMYDWTSGKYHPLLRLGHTMNQDTALVTGNYVVGVVRDAPFKIEQDNFGVMYSRVLLSKYYTEASTRIKRYEDAYEAFYKHHINNKFEYFMSYQFIENPSGDTLIDNAHVIVNRLVFSI